MKKLFLFLVMITLIVSITSAQQGFVPVPSNCESAAISYLKPEMTVRLTESIWFGSVNGSQPVDYQTLVTYFDELLSSVKTGAHRLTPQVGAENGTLLEKGTLAVTTDFSSCVEFQGGMARFWQVDVNGQTGWLMENIVWKNVTLELQSQQQGELMVFAPVIKPELQLAAPIVLKPLQGDIQAQDITSLSSMEAYFLTPHAFAPLDNLPGGTEIMTADCQGAAPSRLVKGTPALHVGSTTIHGFPGVDGLEHFTQLLLSNHRVNVYDTPQLPVYTWVPWSQMGMIELDDNTERIEELLEEYNEAMGNPPKPDEGGPTEAPESPFSETGYLKLAIPAGQLIDEVLDGPFCDRRQIGDANDVTEIFMWWRVSLVVDDIELTDVWMAESVTRKQGFSFVYHYLLAPQFFAEFDPVGLPIDLRPMLIELDKLDSCGGLPQTQFNAGSLVQPNNVNLNVRVVPNGDVLARLGASERLTVQGAPKCWDGYLWWWTDRGGWVAESGRGSRLLIAAVLPTATPEPQIQQPPQQDNSGSVAPQPTAQPPRVEPTPEPTRQRPTPEPTRDPAGG